MCDRALHWKHCAIAISHGRPRLLLTMSSSVSVKSAPHNNAFLVTPAMQCNAMQHNTTHPMDFSSFLQFSVTLQPNATQQNTYILWHSQCNATYLIRGRPPNIFLTCFKIIALLQFPGKTAIHGIVDDKLGSFLVQLVQVSHAASYNKLHNEQPQCLVSTSVKLWKAQMSFVVAKLCSVPSLWKVNDAVFGRKRHLLV